MKLVALVSTLSLTTSTVWASGYVLAPEAPSLRPRGSFQGGWPIEATTCPSNTTSCGNTGECCPGSTNCYTEGLSGDAVCCPTTDNCFNVAKSIPVCADASWTLYMGNYNPFCCTPGQIGVLPNAADVIGSGVCAQGGTNVAVSASASVIYAPGATKTSAASASTAAATGTSEQKTSAPATATSSSTFAKITAAVSSDSARSSSVSIVGIIMGLLLVPFGV